MPNRQMANNSKTPRALSPNKRYPSENAHNIDLYSSPRGKAKPRREVSGKDSSEDSDAKAAAKNVKRPLMKQHVKKPSSRDSSEDNDICHINSGGMKSPVIIKQELEVTFQSLDEDDCSFMDTNDSVDRFVPADNSGGYLAPVESSTARLTEASPSDEMFTVEEQESTDFPASRKFDDSNKKKKSFAPANDTEMVGMDLRNTKKAGRIEAAANRKSKQFQYSKDSSAIRNDGGKSRRHTEVQSENGISRSQKFEEYQKKELAPTRSEDRRIGGINQNEPKNEELQCKCDAVQISHSLSLVPDDNRRREIISQNDSRASGHSQPHKSEESQKHARSPIRSEGRVCCRKIVTDRNREGPLISTILRDLQREQLCGARNEARRKSEVGKQNEAISSAGRTSKGSAVEESLIKLNDVRARRRENKNESSTKRHSATCKKREMSTVRNDRTTEGVGQKVNEFPTINQSEGRQKKDLTGIRSEVEVKSSRESKAKEFLAKPYENQEEDARSTQYGLRISHRENDSEQLNVEEFSPDEKSAEFLELERRYEKDSSTSQKSVEYQKSIAVLHCSQNEVRIIHSLSVSQCEEQRTEQGKSGDELPEIPELISNENFERSEGKELTQDGKSLAEITSKSNVEASPKEETENEGNLTDNGETKQAEDADNIDISITQNERYGKEEEVNAKPEREANEDPSQKQDERSVEEAESMLGESLEDKLPRDDSEERQEKEDIVAANSSMEHQEEVTEQNGLALLQDEEKPSESTLEQSFEESPQEQPSAISEGIESGLAGESVKEMNDDTRESDQNVIEPEKLASANYSERLEDNKPNIEEHTTPVLEEIQPSEPSTSKKSQEFRAFFKEDAPLDDPCSSEKPQIVLYYDLLSPQARSCLMLICLLKLNVELRYIDFCSGAQLTEEYFKLNPGHTVPTMVHNGLILTDSHTILMYLCDTFPAPGTQQLFPSDYVTRLKIMNMLFFEAQTLYRRHSNFMTDIACKQFQNIDYSFHEKKVLEGYETLNTFLKDSQYFVGDTLSIADISIVATVSALDLMFPVDWYKELWPHLYDWFRRIRGMPMYRLNFAGIKRQSDVMDRISSFKLQ